MSDANESLGCESHVGEAAAGFAASCEALNLVTIERMSLGERDQVRAHVFRCEVAIARLKQRMMHVANEACEAMAREKAQQKNR